MEERPETCFATKTKSNRKTSTMRVAIAGTGGLACWIAHYLREQTSHPLILLSRSHKPALEEQGYQVIVVDYDDRESLRYALTGIHTVISTVPGEIQVRLIDAAIRVGVRRFAPAEFEGAPEIRPPAPFDRGKGRVLSHLQSKRSRIDFTVFVCGVFYERFAPGGMFQSWNVGYGSGIAHAGDFLMNLHDMTAQIPAYNNAGQPVTLCLTSMPDVARFIVRSLEIRRWPEKLTMCGDRLTTHQIVEIAQHVRGQYFSGENIKWYYSQDLQTEFAEAQAHRDGSRMVKAIEHLTTEQGRYDFVQPALNALYPDIVPTRFQEWLQRNWRGQ